VITVAAQTGWQPTALQTDLLQAALSDDARIVADAWASWRSQANIEAVDGSTFRLFPLLYRNLETHHIDTPEMRKLRGVYKHAWANNQIQLHHIKAAIRVLDQACIPTLVLKGLALAVGTYHDLGLRATGDGDVLIPFKRRDEALTLLSAQGWTMNASIPRSRLDWLHGAELKNAVGKGLDLHWHLSWEGVGGCTDDAFWAAAIPLALDDVATLMLCPAHQLLHILVHGSWWNTAPAFRWVADAITVIRAGRIDWDRLISQADALHVTLTIAPMLRYLITVFNVPIPQNVIERLENMPKPLWEQIEYAAKQRQRRVWHGTIYHPIKYGRIMLNSRRPAWGFVGYLRDWWGMGSLRRIPAQSLDILVRDARKLWRSR